MITFITFIITSLITTLRDLYLHIQYIPEDVFELPIHQPSAEMPATNPIPENDIPVVHAPSPAAIRCVRLKPENIDFFL
jgi:hypothetical protein